MNRGGSGDSDSLASRRTVLAGLGTVSFGGVVGISGYLLSNLGGPDDPRIPNPIEYRTSNRVEWVGGHVNEISLSPDQELLYAGRPDMGSLRAIDTRDGSAKWGIDTTPYEHITPRQNILYLSGGRFEARSTDDGEPRWKFETDGMKPTLPPAINRNSVYVLVDTELSIDSGIPVYAFSKSEGKKRWSRTLPGSVGFQDNSPVVQAGTLYFSTQSGVMVAMNASDGSGNWAKEIDDTGNMEFTVSDNVVYVVAGYKTLALDAASGKPRWKAQVGGSGHAVTADQAIYVGSSDGVYALAVDDGVELWQADVSCDSVVVHDEFVFAISENKVTALDVNNGTRHWTFQTQGQISVVETNPSTIFIGTLDGLHAVSIDDGKKQWSFRTESISLAATSDEIYLADYNDLYALRTP